MKRLLALSSLSGASPAASSALADRPICSRKTRWISAHKIVRTESLALLIFCCRKAYLPLSIDGRIVFLLQRRQNPFLKFYFVQLVRPFSRWKGFLLDVILLLCRRYEWKMCLWFKTWNLFLGVPQFVKKLLQLISVPKTRFSNQKGITANRVPFRSSRSANTLNPYF